MATLNDYFRDEAREFLNALESSLKRSPAPDAGELHRAVRGLRGTAQMAREQRIFDVVSAFESATRAIADGALAWSDGIAESARQTIADLRVLLDPSEEEELLDARANDAAARWREADPDPTPVAAPPVVDHGTKEFREFAAREASEIADALDQGISVLQSDPMNREPLTIILRRQRALLGSARLEELPVIADILRAVEDLTRVIVKLDVGVKQEWLDIYRVARDALQTTIAPLLRDELPQSSNSVSRLRHMRAELLERYGRAMEAAPPAEDPLARSGNLSAGAPATHATPPGDPHATRAATLPGDPHAPRSGTVPAAPFMGSPRSTPRPAPASPAAHAPPDVSTAVPGVRPVVGGRAAPVEPTPVRAGNTSMDAAEADTDTLELGNDAVVEEGTFRADDAGVDDGAGVLELDEESVVEDDAGMLVLGEDSIIDDEAQMLDLSGSAADEDTGLLQLDDGGLEDQGGAVIELGDDAAVNEHAAAGARTEEIAATKSTGGAAGEPGASATAPGYSREQALQRALELRGVIDRVAAHDPRARQAVDELFTLLKTALG